MNLPEQATCIYCQQTKPIGDLNGHDPMTGDTSQAYCKNLTECDSEFAKAQIEAISRLIAKQEN